MHVLPERYVDLTNPKYTKPTPYSNWERNVIDDFKTLTDEEIKARVAAKRFSYAVLMTHLALDYNLSGVLRVGNALGAQVYYYGERRFDKRGAVGVHRHSPITWCPDIASVLALMRTYTFVGLEQTARSIPLHHFDWNTAKPPLLVVGEETRGLQATPEILDMCSQLVEIQQVGSVRSMNATTSVAIASYDFLVKKGLLT